MSTRDIAKILNIGQTTVRRKLDKYSIATRDLKTSKSTDNYIKKAREIGKITGFQKGSVPANKKVWDKSCPICGKLFTVTGKTNRKTCSLECAHKSSALNNTKAIIAQCEYCGKEIKRIPYRINNYTNQFCNATCKGRWMSKNLSGSNNPNYNSVKRYCANCNTEMFVIQTRNKQSNVYCNIDCMAEHYSESGMWSGSNSPVWKGGKPEYGTNWNYMRKNILKRDNYSCQLCNKTEDEHLEELGVGLSVHHINPIRNFENPNDANSNTNLITLCHSCHSFVHSNNNKEKILLKI